MIKTKRIIGILILNVFITLLCTNAGAANVKMKVIAANVTSEFKEAIPVRQDLPPEIQKSDIVDAGGLKIGYDEEKSIYYVHTKVDLEASSTKTFTVVIKDVWDIPAEETTFLKDQAENRLTNLEGTKDYEAGRVLRDSLVSTLSQVEEMQNSDRSNIRKKIETYRVSLQRLDDIRQKVTVLDDFIKAAEKESDFLNEPKMIRFLISASNPSENPAKDIKVVRYLPNGIKPDHIVDDQGFEVRFNNAKQAFYLEKSVDFEPEERKSFTVLIRDVWHIAEAKLEGIQIQSEDFALKLVDSQYKDISSYLVSEIRNLTKLITESQNNAKSPEEKMAAFSLNEERLDTINKNMEQLKRMADEVAAEKQRSIKEVIKSVTPDVATTWKLIYATMIFLTVISVFFFMLWFGQTKAKQGQAKKLEMYDKKNE